MRDYSKTVEQDFSEQVLDWLTNKTNRSVSQTRLLWEVVGGDWKLLLEVEEAVKTFHVHYCPADMAEAFYLVAKLRTWKAMGWLSKTGNLDSVNFLNSMNK